MKKKFKKAVAVILTAAMTVTVASTALANSGEDSEEITVYVYVNNNGEDYIRNMEFDDGSKLMDYDYTIQYVTDLTRDPNYVATYFDYCAWVEKENGDIALCLDPIDSVRQGYDAYEGWCALSDPYGGMASNPYWPTDEDKLETFKWQYDCHQQYAFAKDYWNLEPHRVANSYLAVATARCNP